jgi:hypothetical protein
MSFRRIVIAGLIVAAALPAPAAYATYMDNPGPAADHAAQSMQMQVQRDQNAPDPPAVSPSDGGFPWLDAALFAGALTALAAVGTGVVRRRQRVVARA